MDALFIIIIEPWFVLADVCKVLEIGNATNAAARLDDDERGLYTIKVGSQDIEMNAVSEPGLYALIATSRKPEAKAFKRWVNHEVLPTIRKTGGYGRPNRRLISWRSSVSPGPSIRRTLTCGWLK